MLNKIILAAAVTSSIAAQPQISTASEFLAAYDGGTPIARKAHELAVSSTEQAYLYANTYRHLHHETLMYCQPDKLTLTPDATIQILRDRIQEKPELAKVPFSFAMLEALIMTFPCAE